MLKVVCSPLEGTGPLAGSQKTLVCAVCDLGQATWGGRYLYKLFTNRYRHIERTHIVPEIPQLRAPELDSEPRFPDTGLGYSYIHYLTATPL